MPDRLTAPDPLAAGRPDPLALWVVPVGELGGVARHVLDVARVGVPGFRVWYLVPPGPLAERLRDLGAPVLTGELGPSAGTATSVATVRRTVTALRPAIVHSHLAYADVVVALATAGLPVRLVSTEHGIAGDDHVYHPSAARQRLMAAVHTVRVRRFDALIAVAHATAAVMRETWHAPRVVVIHNGIDRPGPATGATGTDAPGDPAGLRVASLARLAPEKRLHLLVAAFAELRRSRPHATLTIAGEGPLLADLRAQVARLGLDDAVAFPGFVPADVVLANTDVLAQLSWWENCSYSLLDALVAGVGVCASPVGGNPEILPPECLVVPDDAERVAAVIAAQAEVGRRPSLASTWPTVSEMTRSIAGVYEGLPGQRRRQRRRGVAR